MARLFWSGEPKRIRFDGVWDFNATFGEIARLNNSDGHTPIERTTEMKLNIEIHDVL